MLDVAMTFLKDAPRPREFWARRQTHETVVHMVDALAAALGRIPTVDEAQIDPGLAADGIDELLRGFLTRGRCKMWDGTNFAVAVVPTDIGRRWTVEIAERLTVAPGDGPADDSPSLATISGRADELYLALWNRGAAGSVVGPTDVLERWAAAQIV